MLISISGSQSSGKSTVIQSFERLGYKSIQRKTARSILADWGVTLAEVYAHPALTMKYQDELVSRKSADELDAVHSEDIYFTERTYSDLFGYALALLGPHNAHSKWLDEYYERCADLNNGYVQTFYLEAGHFDVEHDGVRSTNQHFSRMMDVTMRDLTASMLVPHRLHQIGHSGLSDRIMYIQHWIQQDPELKARSLVLDPSTSTQ